MRWSLVLAGAVGISPSVASATVFVSSVTSYSAGTEGWYTTSSAAVGSPDSITGENDPFGPFPNILSPFSPAYEQDELAGIKGGGQITLQFPQNVKILSGASQPEIGVVTNVGIMDATWPTGQAGDPAQTFLSPNVRSAEVKVSLDGSTFYSVGTQIFNSPANYVADASSPYLTSVPGGATLADFGTPFLGALASFDGMNWTRILNELNGSGGGTWIDVPTGLPISEFLYVQFLNPSIDGLYIDTVSANNAAVPEPGPLSVLALGSAMLLRRRRTSPGV